MAQVSKIDNILDIFGDIVIEYFVGRVDRDVLYRAATEAKQALLSAILEVMPEYGDSWPETPEEDAYQQGYNAALDEWEAAIKELFGVKE